MYWQTQMALAMRKKPNEDNAEKAVTVADVVHACRLAYRKLNEDAGKSAINTYCNKHKSTARLDFLQETKVHTAKSGIHYVAMQPSTDRQNSPIIIAFKGTNAKNTKDLYVDAQIGIHGHPKAYQEDANAIVADLIRKHPKRPIIVAGHSLGGALAQHAVAKALKANPTLDIRAVSFGAPGMGTTTRDEIWRINKSKHFICFEHSHDPVGGIAGVTPTNVIYTVRDGFKHGIEAYTIDENSNEALKDSRLGNLGQTIISGNLDNVHQNLFAQEVARLTETDKKYAKQNATTPKLWLAQIVLSMTQDKKLSAQLTQAFQAQISKIERRRFLKAGSTRKAPFIKTNQNKITNLDKIKENLDAEIARMKKNDAKYTRHPGYDTLKLSLFKSLRKRLENPNTNLTNSAGLQNALNSIYALQRDENHIRIQSNHYLAQALKTHYSNAQKAKDAYDTIMKKQSGLLTSKSAKNTPQVDTTQNKAYEKIIEKLDLEIERMKKNDTKYTNSNNKSLKLSLFELLRKQLKESPNSFNPRELQEALNTLYQVDRSTKYPAVEIAHTVIDSVKKSISPHQPHENLNFDFFWEKAVSESSSTKDESNSSDGTTQSNGP